MDSQINVVVDKEGCTIFKYNLDVPNKKGIVTLNVPKGATVLSCANQREQLVVWVMLVPALVQPMGLATPMTDEIERKTFKIVDTGELFRTQVWTNSGSGLEVWKFIGTVMFHGGDTVKHIFELPYDSSAI